MTTVLSAVRLLAVSLATVSVVSSLTTNGGVYTAIGFALAAVLIAERVTRPGESRARPRGVVVIGVAVALVCYATYVAGRSFTAIATALGPARAIEYTNVILVAGSVFATVFVVRGLSRELKGFVGVELFAYAGALAFAFAAHRDGVVARPLWVSDWAFRNGFEPAQVFMLIGASALVVLGVVALLERNAATRTESPAADPTVPDAQTGFAYAIAPRRFGATSRRALAGLMVLLVLAAVVLAVFEAQGVPKPSSSSSAREKRADERRDMVPPPPLDGGLPDQRRGRDGGGQGSEAGSQDAPATGTHSADAHGEGGGSSGGRGDGSAESEDERESDAGSSPAGSDASSDGSARGSSEEGGAGTNADGGEQESTPPPSDGGQPPSPPRPPPDDDALTQSERSQSAPQPVAIVIFETDYSSPVGAYYFRQDAWSEFNGSRLVPTTRTDVDRDVLALFPTEPTRVEPPPTTTERKRVRARVSLVTEHARPFAIEGATQFFPHRNPNTSHFVRSYRFESQAQVVKHSNLMGRRVGNPLWSAEVRAYYLKAPEDPRYAALAQEILALLPEARRQDPIARAFAIKLWLDKNSTYSTKERHANVEDPTADFLFGNKIGYCVHFAHATTYLLRLLGVPARAGVGYQQEEAQRQGGSALLLRSGDAHAWPELYVEGLGWVVLDIAPAKNLDEARQPVDGDVQRMLAEMAREEEEAQAEEEPRRKWSFAGLLLALAKLLGALVGLAVVLLYVAKIVRRAAPYVLPGKYLARATMRAAVDFLGDSGFERKEGETREQFAKRMIAVAPALEQLTEWHVEARLRPNPRAHPRSEWLTQLAAVRRGVGRDRRIHQKLLSMIDPLTVLRRV